MHKKTDTIENMNISYCAKSSRFISAVLIEMSELDRFNSPPLDPVKPSGQTLGFVGVSYQYFTNNFDFEDDMVFYKFDWGDGIDSEWFGPFIPGHAVRGSHMWKNPGVYNVSVKARDIWGKFSGWSDSLSVVIV